MFSALFFVSTSSKCEKKVKVIAMFDIQYSGWFAILAMNYLRTLGLFKNVSIQKTFRQPMRWQGFSVLSFAFRESRCPRLFSMNYIKKVSRTSEGYRMFDIQYFGWFAILAMNYWRTLGGQSRKVFHAKVPFCPCGLVRVRPCDFSFRAIKVSLLLEFLD